MQYRDGRPELECDNGFNRSGVHGDHHSCSSAHGSHHGGQIFRAAQILQCDIGEICDLSASLNPFAPDIAGVLSTCVQYARHYPDPSYASAALAEVIGVSGDRLVLTNGASQAIALLAQLFPYGRIESPTFSLYERHLLGARVAGSAGCVDTERVWRCNPSSPLGVLAASDVHADIWDESFYPLATGSWTAGDDLAWRIGSLTKLWACPGLRLGYVIAPTRQDAQRLSRLQPMWSVSSVALAALEPLLQRTDLPGWAGGIARVRASLVSDLAGFGLNPTDTEANWVLVDADKALIEALFRQRVLVRDLTSFSLSGKARIAVPTPQQYEHLLNALELICRVGRG